MKWVTSCVRKYQEFGATTGRKRRTGWLDIVAINRAVQINSLSGFCMTKLDVLDGLEEVKLCVGYRRPDGTKYLKLRLWRQTSGMV